MPETKRRQFTDEFKSEAVRLTRESGRPVAQVARQRGICNIGLYRWMNNQLPKREGMSIDETTISDM